MTVVNIPVQNTYSYWRDGKEDMFNANRLSMISFTFQLKELYVLLNENYVEDDDNMFRYLFVRREKRKKIMNIFFFSSNIS